MNSYTKNKQFWAILNRNKEEVKKHCNKITSESGIYIFYRCTESGENACYIGQAKNLLERTAKHLMGREQHIDKSLYKRKWYSKDNPYGWKLDLLTRCKASELDTAEKLYIDTFLRNGWIMYNVTGGGQIDKAKDINERQEVKLKSYRNGKNIGAEKVKEQIKVYFEKYLDVVIKGKPNKIKERKLKEFMEFIEK